MKESVDLKNKILELKKERNAVIMAHYYTIGEIQDIADFVGDSLYLAQKAATTDADVIVICGVHFMGETAKILSPEKVVLVPDASAGCSLADSCNATEFKTFIDQHPGYKVLSYVNTTAAVKALTDVVVTSSNAVQIVESFPKDEKIIFGPDRNLGNFINSVTGRNMLLWNGCCHVHEQFSIRKLLALKEIYPNAKLLVHPECKDSIVKLADCVGSTAALLKFAVNSDINEFLVATEAGILHEMKKQAPNKLFIPVPPEDSSCSCNDCSYMKLNTLEKLYACLKNNQPEINVDSAILDRARLPIVKMLEISEKLGL